MSIQIHISGADHEDVLTKLFGLCNSLIPSNRIVAPLPVPAPDVVHEEAPPRPVQSKKRSAAPAPAPEPVESGAAPDVPVVVDTDVAPLAPADIAKAQTTAAENEEAKQKAIQIMKSNYADKDLRLKFKDLLKELSVSSFSEVNDGVRLLSRVEEIFNEHKGS